MTARFDGLTVPDPGFAGDTGAPDPAVAEALASYAADPGEYVGALDAISRSRLLVPVVAVAEEVEIDEAGLAHDKSSEMAAVLLRGADGRLALLAFTSIEALQGWRPDARPVPVAARDAAQAALSEEAAVLLVDVAGPVKLVVQGEALDLLARVGDAR